MYRYVTQRAQLIRSYYSGIGKTGVIIPAAFAVAVGLGLVALGLVFYAREVFGASADRIGLLAGIWVPLYVIGCLAVRPMFRRVLPRYLVVASTAGMFACVFAMQTVPRFEWLYAASAVYGLCISLFWPPLMGWLSSDLEGTALARMVSRFNMSWCSGVLVSPVLCGWLSERDPGLPLLVAGYIFLGSSMFVFGAARVLPRIRADMSTEGGNPSDTPSEHETPLRFPAWVGLFACFFGIGTLNAVFPLYAQDVLALDKSTIGGLFFLRGMFLMTGFYVLGRAGFWHFKAYPMLSAQCIAALLFAGLALTRQALPVALLLGGFGLATSMAYSASIFHGASGSRNRAARMAMHESVLASGVMVGAMIGGWVYARFPASHAYGLCVLLLVGSAGVQGLLVRRQGRRGHVCVKVRGKIRGENDE